MSHSSPVIARNRHNRQRVIRRSVNLLPDRATMVANLKHCLASATPDEWLEGKAWYPSATDIATTVGRNLFGAESNHATVIGAAVIAALSPQCSWEENVNRALAFSRSEEVWGLQDGLTKASRIVDGEESPYLVLGGRKVRSFWRNICGDLNHVTVDRHAFAIVWGRTLSDSTVKYLERIGTYAYVASIYRAVARKHNLRPAELQAITWLAWRREFAYDRNERF